MNLEEILKVWKIIESMCEFCLLLFLLWDFVFVVALSGLNHVHDVANLIYIYRQRIENQGNT